MMSGLMSGVLSGVLSGLMSGFARIRSKHRAGFLAGDGDIVVRFHDVPLPHHTIPETFSLFDYAVIFGQFQAGVDLSVAGGTTRSPLSFLWFSSWLRPL